jgi:DNA-binding IclR family transcriptional regulator
MPSRPTKAREAAARLKYAVPAVEKTFAVIQLFAEENRGRTLSEVSRVLRLPVSTTSSLLHTMHHCGYLTRDEAGRFFLSMKLVTQAYQVLNQLEPRAVAQAELERMTAKTGLTSCMAVLDGDQLVWVAKVEGTGHVQLAAQVGRRMYLHYTSTGKALLAFLPQKQVDAVVASAGLPASSERTITSPVKLKKELAKVRARGYAVDDQETAIGIRGVAAPVFDHRGVLVCSIGLAGAVFEMSGNLAPVAQIVTESAALISERLGHRVSA